MYYYRNSIIYSSTPFEYSSNIYEHMHIALMKQAYRSSNKRDFENCIIELNRRLQALQGNTSGNEDFERQKNTVVVKCGKNNQFE